MKEEVPALSRNCRPYRGVRVGTRSRANPNRSIRNKQVVPKNILMVGPTGCGKTEIARRLAKLTDAPFIKVRQPQRPPAQRETGSETARSASGPQPCSQPVSHPLASVPRTQSAVPASTKGPVSSLAALAILST